MDSPDFFLYYLLQLNYRLFEFRLSEKFNFGDWNGHVGSTGSGYKEVHGGYGYGKPDPDSEGERILEYALAYDLFLGNTCFKKRDTLAKNN